MKRLYTLMASALLISAVAAAAPVTPAKTALISDATAGTVTTTLPGGLNQSLVKATAVSAMKSAQLTALKKKATESGNIKPVKMSLKKAPRKAGESTEGIEGNYIITIGDFYGSSASGQHVEENCTVTLQEDGTSIVITPSAETAFFMSDIVAPYDAATGQITFETIALGQASGYYVTFQPFCWDYDLEDSVNKNYTVTYNDEEGTITFPTDGNDYGFSWLAYADAELTDLKGAFSRFDVTGMKKGAAVVETWTPLEGKGTWFEGLLTYFSDIESGQSWEVEIEKSDLTEGRYRVCPYVEGSPIATLMGEPDNTYVYINATDPAKVVIEDFKPYGAWTLSQLVPENGWPADSYQEYGTLTDGVFNFPVKSFALYNNGWKITNREGEFKIAMPGAVVKDYTLKVTSANLCPEQGNGVANIRSGKDIAKIKYVLMPGHYTMSDGNKNVVNQIGTESAPVASLSAQLSDEGLYSLLVVGLNDAGEVVAGSATYFIKPEADNSDDWAPVEGYTATFTEGFLSAMFTDIEPETLDIVLEESVSTPGRYRFEAPYASHSYGKTHLLDHSADHKHYIYMNATNPDSVYLELSTLGVTVPGFGDVFGYSMVARYLDNGKTLQDVPEEYFGKKTDTEFTMPVLTSFNNEPYTSFNKGALTVTLTSTTPIEETWTEMGKGTWADGFLTDVSYGWVNELNNTWEVTVEKSSIEGRYRMLPYTEGTPVANYVSENYGIGPDNENYVVIDATNPDKVYMHGIWTPFDELIFVHAVPENGFELDEDDEEAVSPYGTLAENGIITFPANSFFEVYNNQQYYANADGLFTIGLPGAVIKLTGMNISTDLCNGNNAVVTLEGAGKDIAAVKAFAVAGYTEADAINVDEANGVVDVDLTTKQVELAIEPGINTVFVIGYEADGTRANMKLDYVFNVNEPADNWQPVKGKVAKYTEGMLSGFDLVDATTVTCKIEENVNTPGRYRLVEPYAEIEPADHADHTHYLYINATNPNRVTIEPSVLGIGLPNYGEAWVASFANLLDSFGEVDPEILELLGFYGTMDDEENTIAFPDGTTLIAFSEMGSSHLLEGGVDMMIQIVDDPEDSITELNADSESEATFFNLRGQRIAKPSTRGIYIRNNRKVFVR